MIAVFPVLGQPAAAVEPSNGPLDDPALGLDHKTLGTCRGLDDLDRQIGHRFGSAVVEDGSGVSAIGEQLAQERELSEQRGQQQGAAVAILNIGRRHQRVQQQALGVDQDMTLLALDQLAAIKARRVDAAPPFSAPFTL